MPRFAPFAVLLVLAAFAVQAALAQAPSACAPDIPTLA